MFPIESVGFNGVLLLAAWRFYSNSQRGQAHARRLFLVSLAYLPLFFACLLLHQRRSSVDEENTLPATDEVLDRLLVNESIERVKERGRELCIHEHVVSGGGSSTDPSACPVPGTLRAHVNSSSSTAHRASSELCPVVVAESVVKRNTQVVSAVPGTSS